MGFKPNSINRRAANKPAGPAPTTITSCLLDTSLYSGNSIFELVKGSSFKKTATFKFILIARCLASIERFKT